MIARCENAKRHDFSRYGERGIKVCERWRNDFAVFASDMGPRPNGATLERLDTDGGYEPENCRWATQKEQQNNRRNNRILEHAGERLTVAQWAERLGVRQNTISMRLNHYKWSIERALSTLGGVRCQKH